MHVLALAGLDRIPLEIICFLTATVGSTLSAVGLTVLYMRR